MSGTWGRDNRLRPLALAPLAGLAALLLQPVLATGAQAVPATAAAPTAAAAPAGTAVAVPASATAWSSRVAAGSQQGVRANGRIWAADHGVVSGTSVAVPSATSALTRHGRTGAVSYRFTVPAPGRYGVTLLLSPLHGSAATVDVVSGTRMLRRHLRVPTSRLAGAAALSVSVLAATATRSLEIGVVPSSGRPVVNAIQVTAAPPVAPTAQPVPAPLAPREPAPVVAAPAGPARSWVSGAYTAGTIDTAAAVRFGSFRGRPLDVADVFHTRDTWDKIGTAAWSEQQYTGFAGKLAIALPLLPGSSDASDLPSVAAGAHDDAFRGFATTLLAQGRGDSIVRLGWEFNGNWYGWSAWDVATWRAAFRHVVQVMKSVDPAMVIDYDGNVGVSQSADPFGAVYPGDDVVDIIGVDAYDNEWNHVTDQASWDAFRTGTGGLDRWAAFAAAHGKKVSVPEWGVNIKGPGDNPFFVQQMHDWFAAHAGQLAYECYFNEGDAYIASALDGTENPRSAGVYRSLWAA